MESIISGLEQGRFDAAIGAIYHRMSSRARSNLYRLAQFFSRVFLATYEANANLTPSSTKASSIHRHLGSSISEQHTTEVLDMKHPREHVTRSNSHMIPTLKTVDIIATPPD
jgi:hypothetical protein